MRSASLGVQRSVQKSMVVCGQCHTQRCVCCCAWSGASFAWSHAHCCGGSLRVWVHRRSLPAWGQQSAGEQQACRRTAGSGSSSHLAGFICLLKQQPIRQHSFEHIALQPSLKAWPAERGLPSVDAPPKAVRGRSPKPPLPAGDTLPPQARQLRANTPKLCSTAPIQRFALQQVAL